MRNKIKILLSLLHILGPVILGLLIYFGYKYYYWYPDNKSCHEQCKAKGYAAGERSYGLEHVTCECFRRTPHEPVRFLLKTSDKLEDSE